MKDFAKSFRRMAAILLCAISFGAATQVGFAQSDFGDIFKVASPGESKPAGEPATLSMTLTPADAKPGDVVTLTVTIKPAPESYTYPMGKGGERTRIEFSKVTG